MGRKKLPIMKCDDIKYRRVKLYPLFRCYIIYSKPSTKEKLVC